uniref:Secreted protein n=1 Tax=Bursaphelenchus xylophilus TaxID=6326 RepID=A0A1I7RLX2_BURXY
MPSIPNFFIFLVFFTVSVPARRSVRRHFPELDICTAMQGRDFSDVLRNLPSTSAIFTAAPEFQDFLRLAPKRYHDGSHIRPKARRRWSQFWQTAFIKT